MSSLAGTLGGAGVLGALAGIAVVDARRMVIRLDLVALLMVAGLCWLFAGGGIELLGDGWWMHLGGAAFGAGMPLALILCAEAAGRRWPIYPGDALLMCAMGGILGLRGFLWALVLGCAVAVLHRGMRPDAAGPRADRGIPRRGSRAGDRRRRGVRGGECRGCALRGKQGCRRERARGDRGDGAVAVRPGAAAGAGGEGGSPAGDGPPALPGPGGVDRAGGRHRDP